MDDLQIDYTHTHKILLLLKRKSTEQPWHHASHTDEFSLHKTK